MRLLASVVLLAVGCGGIVGKGEIEDAGRNDTLLPEASDASDGTITPPFDAGPPCLPIVGTSSFGVRVAGEVTFATTGSKTTVEGALLFPNGRVAGAPVIFIGLWSFWARAISFGTLDPSDGASGVHVVNPICDDEITATLVGPSDGLVASVRVNVSGASPSRRFESGPVKLCATSSIVADPALSLERPATPVEAARLDSFPPLDLATVSTMKVFADGALVPVKITTDAGRAYLTPLTAFPPGAHTIEIDTSGLRDLLGRSFRDPAHIALEVPLGAITDRSFDLPPPSDAILGSAKSEVAGGMLRVGGGGARIYSAILALGNEPLAKTIRFRHRFACEPGEVVPSRTFVVSADATVRDLKVGCSATLVEETISVTPGLPAYLYLGESLPPASPCNVAPPIRTLGEYLLDQISFEK